MPLFQYMDCNDTDLIGETFRIDLGTIVIKPRLLSSSGKIFGSCLLNFVLKHAPDMSSAAESLFLLDGVSLGTESIL